MQNEPNDNGMAENETAPAGASAGGACPPCEDGPQDGAPAGDGPTDAKTDGGRDNSKEGEAAEKDAVRDDIKVSQYTENTQAGLLSITAGRNNATANVNLQLLSPIDAPKNSDLLIDKEELQASKRSYKSLGASELAARTGALLRQRVLLLSRYHSEVAFNIAKSIAYESKVSNKQQVKIGKSCQGNYDLGDLIERLARLLEKDGRAEKRAAPQAQAAVCVWAVGDAADGDISGTILDSLFTDVTSVELYQTKLIRHELCLICLVSPQKIQDYKRSGFQIDLQTWDIDFLRPLLEEYEIEGFEELAETITRQRQAGLWSADDAEFYKEIGRHLRDGRLREVVANRTRPEHGDINLRQLFDRRDPLVDTALYCATYYPDLSPQDFFHLVELFLGDATEEVAKKTDRPRSQDGDEKESAVESVPLARRWQGDTDAVLRRCQLAALTNEDNRRVVDFQVDGLRSRLSHHIRSEHYFFYESNFVLMRRQGLLFSPRKGIAEAARQLLVEMATQYSPGEVAGWLYEIVAEFEEMAQAAVYLPGERPQLFSLLPDGQVRAARHHVCQGLTLVLSRINKESGLQEAARLFWQRLLQTQQRWFLDLLRQVGNSPPPESLNLLRQLLDQSKEEVRRQAISYLVGYLLRRDALIYPTLKEMMQWPRTTQAGRDAQTVFIVYCLATNRQLAQQDYGCWPSSHPLFNFQGRAEAVECIDLLIGWLFPAALEVHEDNALSAFADIVAGWYFILSPASRPEAPDAAAEAPAELDALGVRQLLLERLARHVSRPQRNELLEIWDDYKQGILEEVLRLDEFTNRLASISLDAESMRSATTARRKLMDTRNLISRLREDFTGRAAAVTQG